MAIDPGNTESAYCIVDAIFFPLAFGKVENHELLALLEQQKPGGYTTGNFVIERVASYGLPVGRDVFETCEWIGRFTQAIVSRHGREPDYIGRMEEKMTICHDSRAKDTNIRRALIDRFARHDLENGKGTKKNPDWFYGFKKDIWSAFAVAVTWAAKPAPTQTDT